MFRVGQNHTYIRMYSVYTVLLAGSLPHIRSYTVCIYGTLSREITIHNTYGHIRCAFTFWPTLHMLHKKGVKSYKPAYILCHLLFGPACKLLNPTAVIITWAFSISTTMVDDVRLIGL